MPKDFFLQNGRYSSFYTGWIQLLRLHRPSGVFLLFCPCLWSSIHVHGGRWIWSQLLILFLGSLWARSLGCLHNDRVDQNIDALVTRTCQRPLVGGVLSNRSVWIAMGVLCAAGLPFLWVLPPFAIAWALCAGILAAVYPFCKRWVQWPQVILAFSFNIGVFVAAALAGVSFQVSLFLLFIMGCFWTLEYDLIYAYQDYEDDKLWGIGSLAVLCDGYGKGLLFFFLSLRLIVLAALGVSLPIVFFYGVFTAFLYSYISLKDSDHCKYLFYFMPVIGLMTAFMLSLK